MKRGLLVVDVQNDFCSRGALAVPQAEEIFPTILQYFSYKNTANSEWGVQAIVATADWHPANHSSFALWPPHCIQGTWGAELHPLLPREKIDLLFYKGRNTMQDSYSAFVENDGLTSTGLWDALQSLDIEEWIIVGLATDFCVNATALDAVHLGLKVQVDLRACRAVHQEIKGLELLYRELEEKGVGLIF